MHAKATELAAGHELARAPWWCAARDSSGIGPTAWLHL